MTNSNKKAMQTIDLPALIQTPSYSFLNTDPHLRDRIIFLALSGSYAYGTNNENSDVDLRGCTLNTPLEILGLANFEQYINQDTDTTIYGFNKFVRLLIACAPNVIELLGGKPEHRIMNELGQMLVDNRKIFLSQRAAHSFGGYAARTLRRLQCALVGQEMPQSEREAYLKVSLDGAISGFQDRFPAFKKENINLRLVDSRCDDLEMELVADFHMDGIPVRQFKGMLESMVDVVKNAEKMGQRNRKKDKAHLAKHAMHLIRLYLEGIDVLEKGDIITWRGDDLPLLMSIRHGGFQKEDGSFRPEFYEMLDTFETRLTYAKENTSLPDLPDMKKVGELVMDINEEALHYED